MQRLILQFNSRLANLNHARSNERDAFQQQISRLIEEHGVELSEAAAASAAAAAAAAASISAKERELKEQGAKAVEEVAQLLHEQVT